MAKINCWEFMKCGRGPGEDSSQAGNCPAATEKGLDGVHGGKNGGRACWVVAGTMCRGEVQGTFAKKYKNCGKCTFYIKVRLEEGFSFKTPPVLLNMRD